MSKESKNIYGEGTFSEVRNHPKALFFTKKYGYSILKWSVTDKENAIDKKITL